MWLFFFSICKNNYSKNFAKVVKYENKINYKLSTILSKNDCQPWFVQALFLKAQ